jgi:hypothetical protein
MLGLIIVFTLVFVVVAHHFIAVVVVIIRAVHSFNQIGGDATVVIVVSADRTECRCGYDE